MSVRDLVKPSKLDLFEEIAAPVVVEDKKRAYIPIISKANYELWFLENFLENP